MSIVRSLCTKSRRKSYIVSAKIYIDNYVEYLKDVIRTYYVSVSDNKSRGAYDRRTICIMYSCIIINYTARK